MPINNKEFLMKYKGNCNCFVEIGSFIGDGIQLALDAGFTNIKSVELNENNYNLCLERFKHVSDFVTLYQGASEDLLWSMIKDINEQIMFFIDGHYSGVSETYVTSKGKTFSSIKNDLLTIKKHPIKDHIILIDDRRDFSNQNMDYITEDLVIKLLMDINPNYQIIFDTGDFSQNIFLNDILIALL